MGAGLQASRLVDQLVEAGHKRAAQGRFEESVAISRLAATTARRRYTGRYVHEGLETLLVQLSSMLPLKPRDAMRHRISNEYALHIITRPSLGGHTRLVVRWLELQREVRAHVVMTRPDASSASQDLAAAVAHTGGSVVVLRGTTIERATALRELASRASWIVLSVHEDDVVPQLALAAERGRSPTIFINHADHAFWVGRDIADVIVCIRPAAVALTVDKRGVMADRALLMPLPIWSEPRSHSIEVAKRRLGIEPTIRTIMTVGQAYKFRPLGDRDLVSAVAPILEAGGVSLVAAGPSGDVPPWVSAIERFGPRVLALGPRSDTASLLDAADIFLDPCPLPSITAALEAGSRGIPTLGLIGAEDDWPRIACNDDPALAHDVFAEVARYRERILALVDNEQMRLEAGQITRWQVEAYHGFEVSKTLIDRVLAAAAAYAKRRPHAWVRASLGTSADARLGAFLEANEHRGGLRFQPEVLRGWSRRAKTESRLSEIDRLINGPAQPTDEDYATAIRAATTL